MYPDLLIPNSGKKRYQDDIRLNKAQKKEWKKVGAPVEAIKYWPNNEDDGLVYVPYVMDKRFTPFEVKCIHAAFNEFKKHTRIRYSNFISTNQWSKTGFRFQMNHTALNISYFFVDSRRGMVKLIGLQL